MPYFPPAFRTRRNSAPQLSPLDTADTPMTDRAADRPGRRRPFSILMKKLAGLKAASSGDGTGRLANAKRSHMKKRQAKNNNPYPCQAGVEYPEPTDNSTHYSLSTSRSARSSSVTSLGGRSESVRVSADGQPPPTTGGRSMAPTVSTDHETYTSHSITAVSHGCASSVTGTSRTANGGLDSRRGGDSTFSSPAPSVRSLTTTLTTIQSMAPNGMGGTTQNHHHYNSTTNNGTSNNHPHLSSNSQIIHFNQPFPTASPASAIPVHLTPAGSTTGHPTTYATATANNLLTDNASILTLASSSKRRRRRSFDTDASVRALAPSSLFGGSRESLPLSILSANMNFDTAPGTASSTTGGPPTTPGLHRGTTGAGMANERTSIYSATGILASERNSFYAKQTLPQSGDAVSVRSGLIGHGHADSINGSIHHGIGGGVVNASSPLASPREQGGVEEEDEHASG
ncbi:hypothetical protein B0H66DRAFT_577289 [Apodospora peruviana]|uniref:Uncharacterized protein n=1 Tax=Apodospora peruviana TaxID=516989 RepID=A0AAE0HZI3_9PEZI|nr:hypothetical protein B0H66DRAFT_577289 [Apodospora peruviana]